MITETDDLARAIDAAGARWPEAHGERAELLRKIIAEGIRSIDDEREARKRQRLAAIKELAGSMTGTWPADWHKQMVEEWPE